MKRKRMGGSGSLDGDSGVKLVNSFDFSMKSLERSVMVKKENRDGDEFQPLEPKGCFKVVPHLSVLSEETSPPKQVQDDSCDALKPSVPQTPSSASNTHTHPQPSTLESSPNMPRSPSTSKMSHHFAASEANSRLDDFSMPNPIEIKSKKKKTSQLLGATVLNEKCLNQPVGKKKCAHYEITKTPQWRKGPMGQALCNACGVQYSRGHLFPEYRPLASPTFVASKHSNLRKKVIEMRNAAVPETDPALSPPPEFVPMSSYLIECIFEGNEKLS